VAEDDPWLMIGAGFELSNFSRGRELGKTFRWRTSKIVEDRRLEERYRAAGIENLSFVFAVIDPDVKPPRTPLHAPRQQGVRQGIVPGRPERDGGRVRRLAGTARSSRPGELRTTAQPVGGLMRSRSACSGGRVARFSRRRVGATPCDFT
jgi:hypothetical protein